MNKLFYDMTFDEKLAHIKKCQVDGLEEIRKGSPSNLADIADHLDMWGPWMLSELALAHRKLEVMSDALEYISKGTAHNPPLEAPELASELANERLFDVSEARQALARCKELETE